MTADSPNDMPSPLRHPRRFWCWWKSQFLTGWRDAQARADVAKAKAAAVRAEAQAAEAAADYVELVRATYREVVAEAKAQLVADLNVLDVRYADDPVGRYHARNALLADYETKIHRIGDAALAHAGTDD